MKHLLGFCHRLAYATTAALAGFLLAVHPAGLRIDPTGLLTKLLNLPVAAVGLLLPPEWRGVDLWFQPQEWGYLNEFRGGMLRHLRIAILVYVLIFYLPTLALVGWRRLRHRYQPVALPSSGQ